MPHLAISLVAGAALATLLIFTFLKVGQKSGDQLAADHDLIKSCGDEGLIALYEQATTDAEREDILQFVKEKLATEGKPAPVQAAEPEPQDLPLQDTGAWELAQAGHLPDESAPGVEVAAEPLPEEPAEEEDLSFYTQVDLSGMTGSFQFDDLAAPAPTAAAVPETGEAAQVPVAAQAVAEESAPLEPLPELVPEAGGEASPAAEVAVEPSQTAEAEPEQAPQAAAEPLPPPAPDPLTLEEYINDHFARLNAEKQAPDQPVWPEPGWDNFQPPAEQPQPEAPPLDADATVAETAGLATVFAGSAMHGLVGEAEAEAAAEVEIGAAGHQAAAVAGGEAAHHIVASTVVVPAAETPLEDTIGGTRVLPTDEIDWRQIEAELEAKRQETARIMAQNTHIQEVFAKVKGVENRILQEQQDESPPPDKAEN